MQINNWTWIKRDRVRTSMFSEETSEVSVEVDGTLDSEL